MSGFRKCSINMLAVIIVIVIVLADRYYAIYEIHFVNNRADKLNIMCHSIYSLFYTTAMVWLINLI